jgi:hypothetical protein
MTDFKTGWIPGVSNEDHHRGIYKDCIGSSFLKTFADRSPAHAKEAVVNPTEPTAALNIGSAFHSLALGFPDEVAITPTDINRRTKEGKAQYLDFIEASKGKYIISAGDHANILEMVGALNRHPISKKLMQFKDREITGIFQDFGTDLWCKIRPDLIDHEQKIIVDLKSTVDASYDKFNRDIFKFGYHVSAAWYKYGAEQITGNRYAFIIAAVEKSPPYGINCFNIGGLAVRKAWDKISEHLGDLSDCVINDKWPNYKPFLHEPDVPAWII